MIFLRPSGQILGQYLQTGHDSLFPNPFLLSVRGHHPVAFHEAETPALLISLQTKESSTWFFTYDAPPLPHSTSRQKLTLLKELILPHGVERTERLIAIFTGACS
jgi:hypothetical protein